MENPPVFNSPLLGNVVNPGTLQYPEIKLPTPETHYSGPSTDQPVNNKPDHSEEPKTVLDQGVSNIMNAVKNAPKYAADLTPYGKVVAYNADYTGANFQRYYNHSKFKQLGFSPFRDNETLYNDKGSWADDAGRMLRGWGGLFMTGASDGVKSWADNPFNPEADTDTAKDMERKMSAMTSTRGGFGGGVINFGANTAYSMGLVSEFIAEEAALAAATAVTGGADAEITTPAMAARGANFVNNLGKVGKAMSSTYKALSSLKDLGNAKKFWETVKSGASLEKAFNFINPLENTYKFGKQAFEASKSGEQIYNLAKASKGVGAFFKDVRQLQMVMSESNLEGGTVQNQMVSDMTNEFYNKNGRMPSSEEAEQIYKNSIIAGNKTVTWNMPALFLSNKIVFENMFKGFKPAGTIASEFSEGLSGKLVFNQAWKKSGVNPWEVVQKSWKQNLTNLTKPSTWKPLTLTKSLFTSGLSYTGKNLTEALQEQYQEAVSATMAEYYKNIYQDPAKGGSDEMASIFTGNLAKQFTTSQGLETFLNGFFMGGVLQGPQKVIFEKIPQKIFQLKNPAEFAKRKADKEEWTNNVVNSLNEITKDPAKYFDPISENMVIQRKSGEQSDQASDKGDKKSFIDINDEATFNHIHTVVKSGKLDLITDYLKDLRNMGAEDLKNAFGPAPDNTDPQTYYNNKIEDILDKADYIKKRTDFVDKQFSNPFNPYKYNPESENDKYNEEYFKWKAYEDSKKAAVYSQYSFDRTTKRMSSIIDDVTNDQPIAKANAGDFTLLFNPTTIQSEIESLGVEVSAYQAGTGTQKAQAKKSAKKKEALENLKADIIHYKASLALKSKEGVQSQVGDRAQYEVNMQPGIRVKVISKKGGTGIIKKIQGEYAILDNKRKVKKKYLSIIGKSTLENEDYLDHATEMFHNSYKGYLRVIADLNNDHVFDSKVDDSFVKIKDFYTLDNDSTNLASVVNLLQNPQSFIEYAARMEKVRKSLHEQRTEHTRAALNKYMEIKDQNELLNKLLEDGVFVHPDDIKSLIEDNKIPSKFFDAINLKELDPGSDKYNKALEDIKVFQEVTTTETTTKEEITPEQEPINQDNVKILVTTPISEMPQDLVSTLISAYREENRKRLSNEEDGLDTIGPEATDDQIITFPGFTSFVKAFSKSRNIINNYNTTTGRINEPVSKTGEQVASVPIIITLDMRQQLADLGYTKEEVNKMRPTEANNIIKNQITKVQAEVTATEEESKKTKLIEDQNKAIRDIEDLFNNAQNLEQVEEAEGEVLAMLGDVDERRRIGLTSDMLINMIENKKKELATAFSYKDLEPGVVVVMNDNTKMIVVEKTTDQVKLRKFGDANENFTVVPKDLISTTIKYKYNDGMENININEVVTPEEKELSDLSVKNYTEFNEDDDSDAVHEDMDKAKNTKAEDRDNDLINNLGCK